MRCRNVWILVLVGALGCQTDSIVGRRPVAGAPTTPVKVIEMARESDMTMAPKSEVDMVEQMTYYRTMYVQTLEQLQEYYRAHGFAQKYIWAKNELADARRINAYEYLVDASMPKIDLEPRDHIPAADDLYNKALAAAKDAGHGIPALYNREKMEEALQMFKTVIREFPTSDKIDDAAFYCGELHKEYFNDDTIAVKWYELAWTWDPSTPHPARFQAAVVYDFRLHNREKALELYRASIATETQDRSNVRFAVDRIKQLTQGTPGESVRQEPVAPTTETPNANKTGSPSDQKPKTP